MLPRPRSGVLDLPHPLPADDVDLQVDCPHAAVALGRPSGTTIAPIRVQRVDAESAVIDAGVQLAFLLLPRDTQGCTGGPPLQPSA
jgi:hypothetical protein